MQYLIIISVLFLIGCSPAKSKYEQLDAQIICTLDSKAYFISPGMGDVNFLQRLESMDSKCTMRE